MSHGTGDVGSLLLLIKSNWSFKCKKCQKRKVLVVVLVPSNVIHYFPISFLPIFINNQSLDIFPYDPLSLLKSEEEQVTDAEALVMALVTWWGALGGMLPGGGSRDGAVCLVPAALPQQSQGQIRFPNQSRAGVVGFFLSELVIFPFKLRTYFYASCSLIDLLEHEVWKVSDHCSRKPIT